MKRLFWDLTYMNPKTKKFDFKSLLSTGLMSASNANQVQFPMSPEQLEFPVSSEVHLSAASHLQSPASAGVHVSTACLPQFPMSTLANSAITKPQSPGF